MGHRLQLGSHWTTRVARVRSEQCLVSCLAAIRLKHATEVEAGAAAEGVAGAAGATGLVANV